LVLEFIPKAKLEPFHQLLHLPSGVMARVGLSLDFDTSRSMTERHVPRLDSFGPRLPSPAGGSRSAPEPVAADIDIGGV